MAIDPTGKKKRKDSARVVRIRAYLRRLQAKAARDARDLKITAEIKNRKAGSVLQTKNKLKKGQRFE